MIKAIIADVVKSEEKEVGSGNPLNIVVLRDKEKRRALPIWIGPFEAQSIARGLIEFSTPRPMTYDFIKNLLQELNVKIEEVRIEVLKGDTYYAVVKMNANGDIREIDARPSDAMALAVRTGSPILVAEEVFERAGIDIPPAFSETPTDGKEAESILKELKELQQNLAVQSGHKKTPEEIEKIKNELIASVFRD